MNQINKIKKKFKIKIKTNKLDKASLRLVAERVSGEFKNSCVTFVLI